MQNPRRLLITILTANTLVNVGIAGGAALVAAHLAARLGLARSLVVSIEVVIVTFLVLVIGEITPKISAIRRAEGWARLLSWPLLVVHTILSPFAGLLYRVITLALRTVGIGPRGVDLSEEDVRALVDVGEERGTLEAAEKRMLHSLFDFGDTTVREIMVPRTDMAAVSATDSYDKVIRIIKEKSFSRIPVYDQQIDDIKGILYVRDLLPYARTQPKRVNLLQIARPPFFVPEQKKIDSLLRDFQRQRTNVAIVVDEYGGTAGLVTLEDVLEEIVGEIQDEHDLEAPMVRTLDDRTLIVDARMDLHDMEELLGVELPTEEGFDSLGGFIYSLMGEIPEENEQARYEGLTFTVRKVDGRRISEVEVVVDAHQPADGEGS